MALKGKEFYLRFYVQDLASGHGKTGDAANLTLRIIKDGGSPAAPTNAVTEIDALNMKGMYQVLLTAAEMDADAIDFKGESSTASTEVYPRYIETYSNIPVDLEYINGVQLQGDKLAGNFSTFFQNSDNDTTKIVDNVGTVTGLVKLDPAAPENSETIIKAFKNTDATAIAEVAGSILRDIKNNVLTKDTLFGPLTFDTIVRGLFGAQFGRQVRVVVNPEEPDLTKRIEELEIYDYDNGTLMYKMRIENLLQTRVVG